MRTLIHRLVFVVFLVAALSLASAWARAARAATARHQVAIVLASATTAPATALTGFLRLVEKQLVAELADPIVWAGLLLLIVLFIARRDKKLATEIESIARRAYNYVEMVKLSGTAGVIQGKTATALKFFNQEAAKKGLTITQAAEDTARQIWADMHAEAKATGTHQPSPAKAPAPAKAA